MNRSLEGDFRCGDVGKVGGYVLQLPAKSNPLLTFNRRPDFDMSELDDALYEQVTEQSQAGNVLFDAGDLDAANEKFDAAWELLPEPKTQWEAALWLLAAKADVHFARQQYAEAAAVLTRAAMCPDGLGNPLLHLRMGQAQFELGDKSRAGNEFTMAYMAAGADIFEDEDPKYLDYLKTILQPPVGQDTL
ncbi:hypothetical protein DSM3645_13088 [Blastopirellula marina DSM 3645]|uniref:Tetratricopeptide repeat protein n=2 Tax=Blastopirellula marina TaxID=124 RepID=A4A216_9BACT|nr:hypothetical protein DSM3645_13088 [Blastopirellula marina DSM 3645]